jgi:uncharacterized protein (TIGR02594 family)
MTTLRFIRHLVALVLLSFVTPAIASNGDNALTERSGPSLEHPFQSSRVWSGRASDLAVVAQRHIGASGPALRMKHLQWCAEFMNKVRRDAGFKPAGNDLARGQIANAVQVRPQIGAIVILHRGRSGRSGHTGIVMSFTPDGRIQVLSGNNSRRRVGVSYYAMSRAIAFVVPKRA